MMTKTKKIFLILTILIFLGGIFTYAYFAKTPLLKKNASISAYSVFLRGQYMGTDVTDKIPKEDLERILSKHTKSLLPVRSSTYDPDLVELEVIYEIDGETIQLLLGSQLNDYVNRGHKYNITNSTLLQEEITAELNKIR